MKKIDTIFLALAYIDAGSGSLLVEVIIAAIVSVVFAVKLWWSRIKDIFKGRKNGKSIQ